MNCSAPASVPTSTRRPGVDFQATASNTPTPQLEPPSRTAASNCRTNGAHSSARPCEHRRRPFQALEPHFQHRDPHLFSSPRAYNSGRAPAPRCRPQSARCGDASLDEEMSVAFFDAAAVYNGLNRSYNCFACIIRCCHFFAAYNRRRRGQSRLHPGACLLVL